MAIELTYEQFKQGTQAHEAFAQRYWPYAQQYLGDYEILENGSRISGFLATIAIESRNLEATEESLFYRDPLRLATIFKRAFDLNHDKVISSAEVEAAKPYCCNPDALAVKLYNGYAGRGLIQLTWEKNYRLYMEATGVDVISNPGLLALPDDAFHSACWYWTTSGCNEAADENDMTGITKLVNGPALMHLKERTELFNTNLTMF